MDRDELGLPICNCRHNCACAGGVHSYVDSYRKLLELIRPRTILEWGPGLNTEIGLDAGAVVYSIEHEEAYAKKYAHSSNYHYFIEDVKSNLYVDLHGFGADLYFVDGRRRSECLNMIFNSASGNYVVCLHDAQRSRYRDSVRLFENVIFINAGFCITFRNSSIWGQHEYPQIDSSLSGWK